MADSAGPTRKPEGFDPVQDSLEDLDRLADELIDGLQTRPGTPDAATAEPGGPEPTSRDTERTSTPARPGAGTSPSEVSGADRELAADLFAHVDALLGPAEEVERDLDETAARSTEARANAPEIIDTGAEATESFATEPAPPAAVDEGETVEPSAVPPTDDPEIELLADEAAANLALEGPRTPVDAEQPPEQTAETGSSEPDIDVPAAEAATSIDDDAPTGSVEAPATDDTPGSSAEREAWNEAEPLAPSELDAADARPDEAITDDVDLDSGLPDYTSPELEAESVGRREASSADGPDLLADPATAADDGSVRPDDSIVELPDAATDEMTLGTAVEPVLSVEPMAIDRPAVEPMPDDRPTVEPIADDDAGAWADAEAPTTDQGEPASDAVSDGESRAPHTSDVAPLPLARSTEPPATEASLPTFERAARKKSGKPWLIAAVVVALVAAGGFVIWKAMTTPTNDLTTTTRSAPARPSTAAIGTTEADVPGTADLETRRGDSEGSGAEPTPPPRATWSETDASGAKPTEDPSAPAPVPVPRNASSSGPEATIPPRTPAPVPESAAPVKPPAPIVEPTPTPRTPVASSGATAGPPVVERPLARVRSEVPIPTTNADPAEPADVDSEPLEAAPAPMRSSASLDPEPGSVAARPSIEPPRSAPRPTPPQQDARSNRSETSSPPERLPPPIPAFQAAEAIEQPAPRVPERAARRGETGTIVLKVLVDETGQVVRVVVEEGIPRSELEAAAIEAVLRWKYLPASENGHAIRAWSTATFVFGAQGWE